jgi:uncharacterized membrane protein
MTFDDSKKGGLVNIKIGDKDIYVTGRQEYKIAYTVENAYVEYEGWQELYWNITGNDWPTTIDHASFEVHLPKGVDISVDDLKVFTGKEKETKNEGRIQQESQNLIVGANKEPIEKGEGMTIAVRLPKDYLSNIIQINELNIVKPVNLNNKPFHGLIPAGLLALIFVFWQRKRTRNYQKYELEDVYYPPSGLTSAHVGAYIDHTVNDRDLISLIPYWATEGYIKVQLLDDITYLEKVKNLPHDFPQYEAVFFNAIFKDADLVSVASFKNEFHSTLSAIKGQVNTEIKSQGYYDEGYTSIFRSWKWFVGCFLIIILGILALIFGQYIFLGIGFILSGFLAMFLSVFGPPLTKEGFEIHAHLKAFEKFLKDPSQEKISELLKENPRYFEQMLPYAVAFGIDDTWTKSFESHFDTAPYWYYSNIPNVRPTFQEFTRDFVPKDITSAFGSYPASSSSGGGFSGGGSSGGGFGGGGGSSW